MCTVTFLPKTGGGFMMTHNRDEHFSRGIALMPEKKQIADVSVICPVDANAGGTWIATAKHFTLCLLNGGFEPHERRVPYRHSRGHIIIDFFQYQQIDRFCRDYDLRNIEPFTLIIADHHAAMVNELIFDGRVLHRNMLEANKPYIWSSTTLYTPAQRAQRKLYFQRFLDGNRFSQHDIINFHTNRFEHYDEEGIQINRNDILKTVSLTSVDRASEVSMYYNDLIYHQSVTLVL